MHSEKSQIVFMLMSVLAQGRKSPCLREFIFACARISYKHILFSKNRFTLINLGYDIEELAISSIAGLFECPDGRFVKLENYFSDFKDTKDADEDIQYAKLHGLIRSERKNYVYDLIQQHGDSYPDIKKAVDMFFLRGHKNFNRVIYLGDTYYCSTDFDNAEEIQKEQMDIDTLYNLFRGINHKNYTNAELIRNIFYVLSRQDEFSRCIKYQNIIVILVRFFKEKLKRSLQKNKCAE